MGTSGSACRTSMDRTLCSLSMCAMFNNPFCQSHDWQNNTLQFGDHPNMQPGFTATLTQRDSLYYTHAQTMALPEHLKLNIEQGDLGTIWAMFAPTTALTPDGPALVLRGKQDHWTYNSHGYLVRVHKVSCKALFQPERTCPVPSTHLEDKRKRFASREDNNNEDIIRQYFTLNKHQQRRVLKGQVWTGETWFKVKPATSTAMTTAPPATAVPSIGNKGKAQRKGKVTTVPEQQPGQQQQIARQPRYRHYHESTTIDNNRNSTSKGCESNSRLLDARRTLLETCPHSAKKISTSLSKQTMGQISTTRSLGDRHLQHQQRMEQKATAMKTIGQTSRTKHYSTNGQDQQTLRTTSSWKVEEHRPFWPIQFYNQTKNNSSSTFWKQQRCELSAQQKSRPQHGWTHKLLQTLEQATHHSTLHVCRNSTIHGADTQNNAKARAAFLQRSMARQGHSNRRTHLGNRNTRSPSENTPEACSSGEFRQAAL